MSAATINVITSFPSVSGISFYSIDKCLSQYTHWSMQAYASYQSIETLRERWRKETGRSQEQLEQNIKQRNGEIRKGGKERGERGGGGE